MKHTNLSEAFAQLCAESPDLQGYVDVLKLRSNRLRIAGWSYAEGSSLVNACLVLADSESEEKHPLRLGLHRDDVFQDRKHPNAENCGWEVTTHTVLQGEVMARLEFRLENGVLAATDDVAISIEGQPSLTQRVLSEFSSLKAWRLAGRLLSGQFGYLRRRVNLILDEPVPPRRELIMAIGSFAGDVTKAASNAQARTTSIDVIVPIYNGYELLQPLFDSVLANTRDPYRLILIDDASPDARVGQVLETIRQQRPNTVLLRNEKNLGFVGTVNRASECVRDHFVILNTDVVVPPHWLDRLMAPILSRPQEVASTTPFTNSGTICSFPNFNSDNDMLPGLSTEKIDTYFRRIQPDEWTIELPSGVGFCMGLNFAVKKSIGMFDVARFGRGYGEENDWCRRAKQTGYSNVLVPNLFVQHAHGASFGAEKQQLLERNLKTLGKLHPDYHDLVADFVAEDPAGAIRDLTFAVLVVEQLAKSSALIVDHENGGGANYYRDDEIQRRLGDNQGVFLVTYDAAGLGFRLRFAYAEWEVEFSVEHLEHLHALFRLTPLDEVVYNNMVGYPNIIEAARFIRMVTENNRAKLIVLIHDFLPVCGSYVLLDDDGRFCGVPELSRCEQCLRRNKFAAAAQAMNGSHTQADWRAAWLSLIDVAASVVVFSTDSKHWLTRAFPSIDEERVAVVPHSVNYMSPLPQTPRSKEHLTIGVVGAINEQKGAKVVRDLARLLESHTRIRIVVIGTITEELPTNVFVTGAYQRDELSDLVARNCVDLFVIPSIWPETFSYVASELQAFGKPIVCFNLGAHAERLRQYEHGIIVDEISAQALADVLPHEPTGMAG